jgi:Tat protein translocase TatB subunit
MDTFFNIGGWELLVILLIAGIVMGPKRIRDVAHWLGKTTAQLQKMSRAFMQQLNAELDAVDSGELRAAMEDVQDLRRQVQELRQELTTVTSDTVKSGQEALRESQELVENSIAPPEKTAPPTVKPADSISNGRSNGLPKPIAVADDPE